MTTPRYAAIDDPSSGTVYGLGATKAEAIEDARRSLGADADDCICVSITPAAYAFVEANGGSPSHRLSVSSDGVCLLEEE